MGRPVWVARWEGGRWRREDTQGLRWGRTPLAVAEDRFVIAVNIERFAAIFHDMPAVKDLRGSGGKAGRQRKVKLSGPRQFGGKD